MTQRYQRRALAFPLPAIMRYKDRLNTASVKAAAASAYVQLADRVRHGEGATTGKSPLEDPRNVIPPA
jgi:hypothetical protein